MATKKKQTYEAAYAELQEILTRLQSEEVAIDDLAATLKRAREIVAFCKDKLHKVEEELQDILEEDE